jgi:molecular chaperone GrpE
MSPQDPGADLDKILEGLDFARLSEAREEQARRDRERLLLRLVDVADALRALSSHCRDLVEAGHREVPSRSAELILRQLLAVLAEAGVRPMEAAGRPVDLELHEVVAVRAEPGAEEDSVLEELVFGYLWNDRPLRRAKVVIAAAEGAEG